jgi:RNA polymerase sigma factor (sigma-70 family)
MHELDGAGLRDAVISGGDKAREAFRTFWEAYYRRFSVFAASYRGLPGAERHDAVADALIAVFGALGSYDPHRPLSPWAYRIAANSFSDASRRAARESGVPCGLAVNRMATGEPVGGDTELEPPAPGDHADNLANRDLVEHCRAAIARLPETDRRIAMLRFYEGMDAAGIGRVLGMPAGTVRWRISVIRTGIKAAVGEDSP